MKKCLQHFIILALSILKIECLQSISIRLIRSHVVYKKAQFHFKSGRSSCTRGSVNKARHNRITDKSLATANAFILCCHSVIARDLGIRQSDRTLSALQLVSKFIAHTHTHSFFYASVISTTTD